MFCDQCGAKIPDESRFCTSCGAPVPSEQETRELPHADATGPAPAATTGPAPEPAAAQTQVRAQPADARRRGLPVPAIVAIALAAALLAGVGVAAFLTGGFGLLAPEREEPSEPVEVEPEPEVADEAADPEAEPAEQEAPSESSSIRLSLSDQGDYGDVNLFLTNFTELSDGISARDSFSRDDPLDDETTFELIRFMQLHMSYNENPYVESVAGTGDPMAEEGYATRVPADYFVGLLYDYVGVELTYDQLSYDLNPGETQAPMADRGTVSDGWFYYVYEQGVAWPTQGVAVATSLEDLGGNRYEVAFDVYRPDDTVMPTDIAPETYGLPLDEMLDELGGDRVPEYSATAVFEVSYDEDGELLFTLVEMN